MSTIEQAVEVQVPVRVAYNQWTQFEEFPRFMQGVERVEQLDDRRLHWVGEIAGKRNEWDAEISEQRPDERVAWHSTSGAPNAGVVTFHRVGPRLTHIELNLDIAPHGPIEKIGRGMRFTKRAVRADLHRFKAYAEMNEA